MLAITFFEVILCFIGNAFCSFPVHIKREFLLGQKILIRNYFCQHLKNLEYLPRNLSWVITNIFRPNKKIYQTIQEHLMSFLNYTFLMLSYKIHQNSSKADNSSPFRIIFRWNLTYLSIKFVESSLSHIFLII